MRSRAASGFTLLEVMVALAILAISLGAAIKSASTNAVNAAYLREKTLAQWVAMNVVAELQLQAQWPEAGERRGRVDMAGITWKWDAQISPTFDADIRRLDVKVAMSEPNSERAQVVGYLPRPASTLTVRP